MKILFSRGHPWMRLTQASRVGGGLIFIRKKEKKYANRILEKVTNPGKADATDVVGHASQRFPANLMVCMPWLITGKARSIKESSSPQTAALFFQSFFFFLAVVSLHIPAHSYPQQLCFLYSHTCFWADTYTVLLTDCLNCSWPSEKVSVSQFSKSSLRPVSLEINLCWSEQVCSYFCVCLSRGGGSVCVCVCVDGWVSGWVSGWVGLLVHLSVCLSKFVCVCVCVCVCVWMGGWVGGWVDGWVRWSICLSV